MPCPDATMNTKTMIAPDADRATTKNSTIARVAVDSRTTTIACPRRRERSRAGV
jgi:hypothetical protein